VLWLIFVILAAGIKIEEALAKEGTERGLGLTSMRERSELSGGALSIEPSPGHGTVVQVTWPEKTGAGEESGDGGK